MRADVRSAGFTIQLTNPETDACHALRVEPSELLPGALVGHLRTVMTTPISVGTEALHPVALTVYLGPAVQVDPDALYGPLAAWLRSVAAALDHEIAGGAHVEPAPHT